MCYRTVVRIVPQPSNHSSALTCSSTARSPDPTPNTRRPTRRSKSDVVKPPCCIGASRPVKLPAWPLGQANKRNSHRARRSVYLRHQGSNLRLRLGAETPQPPSLPPVTAPPLSSMAVWNVFRFLGDISHTISKCILIWAIHSNRSAEGQPHPRLRRIAYQLTDVLSLGVSLLTQALYVLVFLTRYLDLFWTKPSDSEWNFSLKNFYIWSSIYVMILMIRVFPRSREREKSFKLGGACLAGSLILAPIASWTFERSHITFIKVRQLSNREMSPTIQVGHC